MIQHMVLFILSLFSKSNRLHRQGERRDYWARLVYLGILVLFTSSCAQQLPNLQRLSPLPSGPICRVAVLPFESDSDYPLASLIASMVFSAQLTATENFIVAQAGDVRKIYQQLRILPGHPLTQEQYRILGSRLNVQLLITGKVIKMQENPAAKGSVNPILTLQIDILDGSTAKTLWSTYHHRQGIDYQKAMHFGTIHSVTDLCQQVAHEIINLWFKQGLTPCDVSPLY